MGKISGKVSKGLGAAIKEAQDKMNGVVINIDNPNDIENLPEQSAAETLLNSGAEAQKKRHRRTKAEMQAAKQAEEPNSLFESLEYPKEDTSSLTFEEFCERELQQAVEKGLPEPDFDFRNFYEKGTTVNYVRVLESFGTKEIIIMKLRTIYPRMMVGATEAGCFTVGYKERNQLFSKHQDAKAYADSLKLTPKYVFKASKTEQDDDEDTNTKVDDKNAENEASVSSEEVTGES